MSHHNESRRSFLKKTAAAAGATLLPMACVQSAGSRAQVFLDAGPADPITQAPPVRWALGQLSEALRQRGFEVFDSQTSDSHGSTASFYIQVSPSVPLGVMPAEAFCLGDCRSLHSRYPMVSSPVGNSRPVDRSAAILAADIRGYVYGLLELSDRLRLAPDPVAALALHGCSEYRAANQVRSVGRLFASDIEDKGWFNAPSFWERYLTELATHRFNRFSLMLGLGYDFTTGIRDAYFHFAYPFLVSVPGYSVRAVGLPEEERAQNLEQLKRIGAETVRRGLRFQLGIWTHAWQWVDSPHANYVIEGVSSGNHAAYCRDALAMLLRECPDISGLTLRTHGESGVAEGSYEFWKTVFQGVTQCGRKVEIDLHAKGLDDQMIELALGTGMPVTVSPKFWAEHMGLGYMQGAIRPLEMPPKEESDRGFFAKSNGSRRFLRYGYGDLLKANRGYGVVHRIWPGTQRLLLWGCPELAADYGRAASFCGSQGVEWFEPLSFKGRKGSGLPGGREAYADASLLTPEGDFEKYCYSYRVWGRHLYSPNCEPAECSRFLEHQFGAASSSVATALSASSQILPLITTAHCPSAANNNYWPEMYTNMAMVDPHRPHPYGDTLSPKRFGTVSSLDPEFFSRIDDFARALLQGTETGKYSPAEVAASLEELAKKSAAALAVAHRQMRRKGEPAFRRAAADITIQNGLGSFFAWKFRAGVLFAIYSQSSSQLALRRATEAYRRARDYWAEMAEAAQPVYRPDVTFGPESFQRGHWTDRLPAIDADLADLEKPGQHAPSVMEPNKPSKSLLDERQVESIIRAVMNPAPPLRGLVSHVSPQSAQLGKPLKLTISKLAGRRAAGIKSVNLRYRHVNQGEVWQTCEMLPVGVTADFEGTISAGYTASPFPLQYHFAITTSTGRTTLYPGFEPGFRGQPYFVVELSGKMPGGKAGSK